MRKILAILPVPVFVVVTFFPCKAAAKTISLDGNWIFVADPAASFEAGDLARANGIPVGVPSSWQAAFVDRRDYARVAWSWRNLTV